MFLKDFISTLHLHSIDFLQVYSRQDVAETPQAQ